MLRTPKVLLLVCEKAEKALLQQLLSPHAELAWACNPEEMVEQLGQDAYDTLFCARSLCRGNWQGALEEVQQQYPNLPVIILSPTASEQEWVEVLEAGAFDLLGPPYYERSLLCVLEQAVSSHEARIRYARGEHRKVRAG
ncbi:MAG: response regulator [Acidobacteria bacterium]|nr:response regulator [Acidobacteriota bacterium]